MIYREFPYVCTLEELTTLMEKCNVSYEVSMINLVFDIKDLTHKYGSESVEHRGMKKAVIEYLKNLGELNSKIEYGYIDVYSPKFKIAIEVGDTPVGRIVSHLYRDYVKEVWTIDYSNTDNYELIKFTKNKTPRPKKPYVFDLKRIMSTPFEY